MQLIEITEEAYGVEIALAYATAGNFTGEPVYRADAKCFLNADAAAALKLACDYAKPLGYHFRILDAFRPLEAQWKFWEHTPDPDFLTDPNRGSPHSMGAAVDLALVESASGAVLDFGTGFDAFTPLSYHGNQEISVDAQRNRHLLMGIMTTAGWDFYRNEWWHYQLFNARQNYPVLSDVDAKTGVMLP
ncbi:MAG: D-alanyl-D-alanine dipeptidase [Rickettsiales bacterium]|nr:D-alanyl-D-alanine dipeptidase [Rickettsiales bacterium]